MLTTNEAVDLVKKGYINGSVYQYNSLKELTEAQVKLCNRGWKFVHQIGALTLYTLEKDGINYWYTLIY